MSCRSGKLLFVGRVFVTAGGERRLGLHSRGLVSNGTESLGVILLWQSRTELSTVRWPLETTYLLVANTLGTGGKVGWVGGIFDKFDLTISILVYSFLSNSILVTLVSNVSSEGTGSSFSLGSITGVFSCLVLLQWRGVACTLGSSNFLVILAIGQLRLSAKLLGKFFNSIVLCIHVDGVMSIYEDRVFFLVLKCMFYLRFSAYWNGCNSIKA